MTTYQYNHLLVSKSCSFWSKENAHFEAVITPFLWLYQNLLSFCPLISNSVFDIFLLACGQMNLPKNPQY